MGVGLDWLTPVGDGKTKQRSNPLDCMATLLVPGAPYTNSRRCPRTSPKFVKIIPDKLC